jgi:hypothetical protein
MAVGAVVVHILVSGRCAGTDATSKDILAGSGSEYTFTPSTCLFSCVEEEERVTVYCSLW